MDLFNSQARQARQARQEREEREQAIGALAIIAGGGVVIGASIVPACRIIRKVFKQSVYAWKCSSISDEEKEHLAGVAESILAGQGEDSEVIEAETAAQLQTLYKLKTTPTTFGEFRLMYK